MTKKAKNSGKSTGKKATPVLVKAISTKYTKNQILKAIAEDTGLSAAQVKEVFVRAGHLAKCHLTVKGSGEFAIPEMAVKIVRKTRPASKKREGRNPATGETITIAARPKREVIKVRALKALKEVLA